MPREQHRTSPLPPQRLPVTGKGQASRRAACGLSPALDQLGLSLSFRAAPGASYSPSALQPAPLVLLHARLLPPKGKKRRKDKAGTDFPRCPLGLFLPRGQSWAAWGHGGGCLHKKPRWCPCGIAQPYEAQSILPLNMKLPLSPNPLPRGWVSPHFSSLMLTRCGGLRGSLLLPLSFFPVSSSPPLSFPSFSSGYFSGAGMLVLLLLPSSCDLNIKHRRKISPRAPSPGSIPGPRLHPKPPPASLPGWAQPQGRRGCHQWAPPVPEGPPPTPEPLLPPHTAQTFSCPFPSQFPSGFSISACLGRGIFNPSWLGSCGAEKGRSLPLVFIGFRGLQGLLLLSWREETGNVLAHQKRFALQLRLRRREKPFLLRHRDSWLSAHGAEAERAPSPLSVCARRHVCTRVHVHVCACVRRAGRGAARGPSWGTQVTSPRAPAGVRAWRCPPACVRWMCPCLESRADAPGCRRLWRGMPLPPLRLLLLWL